MENKIRILHVDDNQFDRSLVQDALLAEHDRFEILEADSREKFEQHLTGQDFDLVLSDFNILGFDGLQVLQLVKEKYPDIPVIIVTGTGSEEIAIQAMKMGADDYVIKSVKHIRGLVSTMETVLENKKNRDERKIALTALQESEVKLRAIMEQTTDFISITDDKGFITYASSASDFYFLYTPEEICGHHFTEFVDESATLSAIEHFKGLVEGSAKSNIDLMLKRRDGSTFIGEVNGANFRNGKENGVLVVVRDITERKQAEELLRESEKYNRMLFEKSFIGLAVNNMDGKLIDVNQAYADIIGRTINETLKLSYWDITPEKYAEQEKMQLESLNTSGYYGPYEKEYTHKNGDLIPVRLQGSIIDRKGRKYVWSSVEDITGRKKAELQVKERERQLASMVGNLPGFIYRCKYDKDWTMLFISEGCKYVTGYMPEDFIENKKIAFNNIIGDEYQHVLYKEWEVAVSNKTPFQYEYQIVTSNNEIKWVFERGMGIFGENDKLLFLEGYIEDITERKLAEEKLKSINERFELAINAAAISVWEHDFITDKIKIDDNFNKIFGITQGNYQIEFNEFIKIIHPDDVGIIKISLEKAIESDKNTRFEFRIIRPDGDIRNVEAHAKIVKDNTNKPVRFIGINLDISESKKAEQELILAKEQAEESDRLKSAFLANMSHEIRTPMNGILGFAALLKEPKLTGEEKQDYIGIIEKSGARMLNIISDIMTISKVEAGQLNVSISETNINEQIEFIYTFFKPEADEKGLQLFFKNNLPSNKAVLKTDKEKVYAILINVVKNAIKFTRKGSIEFGYEKKGNFLEFFVKDSGVGIIPEHQEIIFERFRQSSDSLTRQYEGAGLGLAISKAYVEMLGGKIWVKSKPGKGSVFYFTLPYENGQTEKAIINHTVPPEVTESQVRNLKILIAEDDKISERLLMLAVKRFSREILIVKNGIEAVETCHNQPGIDLILMDIQMPQIDGYEATRQIRQFNTKVIIIAQTAYALAGDRIKAIAAGCDDYIPKPIDKALLAALINKYFLK